MKTVRHFQKLTKSVCLIGWNINLQTIYVICYITLACVEYEIIAGTIPNLWHCSHTSSDHKSHGKGINTTSISTYFVNMLQIPMM